MVADILTVLIYIAVGIIIVFLIAVLLDRRMHRTNVEERDRKKSR